MAQFQYNKYRTFLVDSLGSSLLLRGNQPLGSENQFAYSDLTERIQELSPGFDLSLCTLINVSLLDNISPSERADLKSEFQAFGISGSQFETEFSTQVWPPYESGLDVQTLYGTTVEGMPGSLVWFPFRGCTGISSCSTVETLYHFSALPDFLHSLLLQPNTVIYYHCQTGNERTGALTACYLMKYKGATLTSAKNDLAPVGAKLIPRNWETDYENLMDWYASTLS